MPTYEVRLCYEKSPRHPAQRRSEECENPAKQAGCLSMSTKGPPRLTALQHTTYKSQTTACYAILYNTFMTGHPPEIPRNLQSLVEGSSRVC